MLLNTCFDQVPNAEVKNVDMATNEEWFKPPGLSKREFLHDQKHGVHCELPLLPVPPV